MSPASYRKPGEKGLIAHLKEYWFLYAFITQLIWTFGFASFTMTDHEKRIMKIEGVEIEHSLGVANINAKLASIETSLKFIEQMVSNRK